MTALGLSAAGVFAQPAAVDWSGLAWIDYAYTVSSDDPDLEGANSFDYRRIYLTADVDLDDDVRMRVRLEALGRATTEAGRPSPFVKDVWVRWQYAESGHRATIGVQPPPLFQISESVWGYRSLDRTVIDRSRIRSSRDMGLRLDGPIALDSRLRYAVMIGNGRGVRPEPVGEEGKHVYGQIIYADGPFRATLGADYTANVPNLPDAERRSGTRVSALVGSITEHYRLGLEGYYNRADFDRERLVSQDGFGVSAFAVVNATSRTSLVARYDYIDDDARLGDADEHYVLGAVAYHPVPYLQIIPNVIATVLEGADLDVLARVTVAARF